MTEYVGKFAKFLGDILDFFRTSFFSDPAFFFSKAAETPTSSMYEILFVAFLLGVAVTVIVGVVGSVLRVSPLPFIRTVESYIRLFGKIGAWILVALIISMVYEVVSRYFFGAPTKWAFEVAYMLMGTSFMFGIAYCMQMRRHIRVDFVYDHVSLKWRAIIDLFGFVFLVPMLLWLCGGVWDYFHQAYRVDETSGESAWNPIIWPFKFTFVIGFVLLLMQTVVEITKSIMVLCGRDAPQPPSIEGLN